jgi:cytochrome c oxidase cbb3-type subunit 1
LQPAHWFLLAGLFWFPWIYSTANLFLVAWPVRGVTQAVIDWWFSNNLIFVCFGLLGLGTAFYLLSKISARPLQATNYALFAFWTFVLFAPWCGMPQTAPIPAWLPAASGVASGLMVVPVIALCVVYFKTVYGVKVECKGGPYCHAKFAMAAFILSALMLLCWGCPVFGKIVDLTWFGPAQVYMQLFGFFAIVICAGIYESLAGVMGFELPFPGFVRLQHWAFMIGLALLVVPLAWCGIHQGFKMEDATISFSDIIQGTLLGLRVTSMGWLFLLLGSLMLAANIFVMTVKWHLGVVMCVKDAITAPLETQEVKS